MKENTMKKSLLSVIIIFIGTLLVITLSRAVAGTNGYMYFVLPTVWFVGLFFRDIKTKKEMLSNQWGDFKKTKWRHMLYVIITLFLASIAIQITRPIFNQFIPTNPVHSYDYDIDTSLGLLFSVLGGIVDLVVAFVEEVTYRYEGMYVYKYNKLLLVIMLILSSLLFGFSHYYNFGGSFLASIPYAFAGLVFGLMYLWTKNIWVPIMAHLLFNSTAVLSSLFLVIVKLIS
ncbi:CPBP family intramembrane glutamic endopeptidase [Vagococcus sp. JNUCC 83]